MLKSQTRKTLANRVAKVPPARQRALRTSGCEVCLGTLVGWDDKGPLVDFDGNRQGPLRARVSGTAQPVRSVAAPANGQEIVLLVDPRPGRPPILLGVLRPLGTDAAATDIEARVDGRRVEIEGRDEIILRCGEASITLRRNGRVVIHGVQVETRAKGVNRIKGGSVAIN